MYVKSHEVYTHWMRLYLCLYLRFDSVFSFKDSAGQKLQRRCWTKEAACNINKHTTRGRDNTQPQISTSLHKVTPVKCWMDSSDILMWGCMDTYAQSVLPAVDTVRSPFCSERQLAGNRAYNCYNSTYSNMSLCHQQEHPPTEHTFLYLPATFF